MTRTPLPESQMGPAERLLDVVLGSSAHLWHNRPGMNVRGTWQPARGAKKSGGTPVAPGLFVPAAVALYSRLLEIHKLNAELMAHLASYALVETDWRDLKVACAALMLVQARAGVPVHDDDGTVAFYDDDYRRIGEAMVLWYQKKSPRMLTPKAVLRIAELLEVPEIAALNRRAGFGDPAAKRAPMGRWSKAAARWLAVRETNPAMLHGLVKAGYKQTIKNLARKVGYKPSSPDFFGVLGWKQSQKADGRRAIGLDNIKLAKSDRFDGLSEAEICETIVGQRLRYKDAVGRLPKDVGLTPAIMVALLPTLSDRDLRQLTPTLEELGLMAVPEIRARWDKAIASATDQRGLNIAKNVRDQGLKDKLAESADNAAKKAVADATKDTELRVMFLVDKSGSMQGAIESSKEALGKLLAGFPLDRLHVAAFDTMGQVLRPKAASRVAVQHVLAPLKADGGTIHGAALQALYRDGMRVPAGAQLIVIVVGDQAGEQGTQLAGTFRACGYQPSAMALIHSGARGGVTVRDCARELRIPFSEVTVDQFDDPYHVTRVLRALLEAPVASGVPTPGLVEKVMATKLIEVV
ncbi:MAG TPA: VWA domain-containing protein [Kofleriaceae bacterium]|nr:VWA domain-containing protein [Kofleriaceae bacterium]